MAAVKDAGLTQIDHLITTHWHGDHFGGMAELAARIPIRDFIDHGPNVQPAAADRRVPAEDVSAALREGQAHGRKARRQDPVAGLDCASSTSAGETIKSSVARRRRPNPYCAGFKPQDADKSENALSVGIHVTFGRFRTLHLGDLT